MDTCLVSSSVFPSGPPSAAPERLRSTPRPRFSDESPTAARNRRAVLIQTLVDAGCVVMDHAGESAFTDLVEVVKAFGAWERDRQRLLLALTRGLNGDKPFP